MCKYVKVARSREVLALSPLTFPLSSPNDPVLHEMLLCQIQMIFMGLFSALPVQQIPPTVA